MQRHKKKKIHKAMKSLNILFSFNTFNLRLDFKLSAERVHERIKPLECKNCDKRFVSKSSKS